MSLVRVHNLAVSLDGFATGVDQSLESPFGHAGMRLMQWFHDTATFRRNVGEDPGDPTPDDAFAARWDQGIGAEIMGAGKFGPPGWEDDASWQGWWGEEPPFHSPVVVLTHRPRPALTLGGTTFHFLDTLPRDALEAARTMADGLDVRIGGGPTTVREFLAADLIDLLHVAVVPVVLGRGTSPWTGLDGIEDRFVSESVTTPSGVTHVTFTRRPRE
ncbi:dihydrofolate reductase family protein [Demequina sp. SYSU T00068]|uniref:dihydrofolate reductase family protein n=1 Tax=Demequina lignilytica TaxID=3051663 RepID=UPI00262023AB|nr:dihydrofolate reductase family protein [Demequina sp. SYSU T00068]MDN4489960.1 dihydrofolate reductase family protein [Demequina sp. SYSU T00068]